MGITRSEFIRLGFLGTAFSIIPGLKVLNGAVRLPKDETSSELATLCRQGKSLFYAREYDKAETFYIGAINKHPGHIQLYNGLAKVYGARQRMLERVELYRKGWMANEENVIFYDRLARSLRSLALGNNKQVLDYVENYGTNRLLEEAAYLYLLAIDLKPDQAFLRIELGNMLRDLERHKKHTPIGRNDQARVNTSVLQDSQHKKINGNVIPVRLSSNPAGNIKNSIQLSESRSRRSLQFIDEKLSRAREQWKFRKRCYRALYSRYAQEQNMAEAENWALKLWEFDPNDSDIMRSLKQIYINQGRYPEFVEICRENHKNKQTYWSELALAKAWYVLGIQTSESTSIHRSEDVYLSLLSQKSRLPRDIYVSAFDGMAKIHLYRSEFESAISLYVEALRDVDTTNRYVGNNILIGLSNAYFKKGDTAIASWILEVRLSPRNSPLTVESSLEFDHKEFLVSFNERFFSDETKTDIALMHSLVKLYDRSNRDKQAREVTERILALQPNDKVARQLQSKF